MGYGRSPKSIYQVVACIVEYRALAKSRNGKRHLGITELAKKHGVNVTTVNRWVANYSKDMRLFSASQVLLLSKLASKEDRLEQLAMKYKRLRQSKPSVSSEGRVLEQLEFLKTELKMFRDLYNEARRQLEELRRLENVNRTRLYRAKRQAENLKMYVKQMSPDIEDTSLDVYGAGRSNP